MNNLSRSLWGILLVVIGVVIGLNSLNITHIDIFFEGWWTLFIIVPCFIGLFEQDTDDKKGNIIGLIIGIALLLGVRGIIRFDIIIKLIVPFILVAIGLSFIFSDGIKNKVSEKIKNTNCDDLESIVATFSEQKVNKDEEIFKGANLDAVFGGITLDLSKSKLEKEVIIKASSIFGGITLMLPKDVNVKIKSTPIFGGVNNKNINHKENKKTIYIDAFCMFGGIDIKWMEYRKLSKF